MIVLDKKEKEFLYKYQDYLKLDDIVKFLDALREETFSDRNHYYRILEFLKENDVQIPSAEIMLKGKSKILAYYFSDDVNLKSIEIPEGIQEIDQGAFKLCLALMSVKFPSTLKVIRNEAFTQCVCLPSIQLPEGLEKIEARAFLGCRALQSVKLPGTLKAIGMEAFHDCFYLDSIDIPENVRVLSPGVFEHCSNLTSVRLPGTLTEIHKTAFYRCGSLQKIEIPRSTDPLLYDAVYKENLPEHVKIIWI